MFGNSDNNRSEGPGGCREALSTKAVWSKGTTVGTQTGSEAEMRAMSVRENAKSNRHRKTHLVEPDGTGREFMHLTRGDLPCESRGEVSRGHSSADDRGNPVGAKGRRMRETMRVKRSRVVVRNDRAPSETWFPLVGVRQGLVDPIRHRPWMARCLVRHWGWRFPEIQPPDAANRMSGGVEGSRGAIPVTPSDRGKPSLLQPTTGGVNSEMHPPIAARRFGI
jgi:hypothetical protein